MMTIGNELNLTKKKLDCLRRVKVKSLVHKRQIREKTIPIDLSSNHEVCFIMKSAFKVMDVFVVP